MRNKGDNILTYTSDINRQYVFSTNGVEAIGHPQAEKKES